MVSLIEQCSHMTRKAILIGPQDLRPVINSLFNHFLTLSKIMPGTEKVNEENSRQLFSLLSVTLRK